MAEETTIQVNFARPVPLFPLESPVLLPQQVLALHIFEPRYIQMVESALDGPGQFAVAVFDGDRWKQEYHGRPPIMPAVCLAQIIQHERVEAALPDQDKPVRNYNILVRGICRARIIRELPASAQRLYRAAQLEPIGIDAEEETKLYGVRERLTELLEEGPLTHLTHAEWVADRIRDEEIPTAALLELVSFTLPMRRQMRYRLLEEGDAGQRAEIISRELVGLRSLLKRASAQRAEELPKGVNWN